MKMKTIQRAFAWALTLVMVLSAAPLGVFAEGEDTCTCTTKCVETANADCPVCGGENGNPAACAGTAPEEQETKEPPTPPKAENKTPENKVEKETEDTTDDPPAAGGDVKTTPEEKETSGSVEGGQGGSQETKSFTITFNANGGDAAPASMTTKEDGTLNGALPTPTRAGHAFGGWFETQDCTGTKVEQNKTYAGDTTLYAKWTENTPSEKDPDIKPTTGFTVTFDFQLEGVENVTQETNAEGKLVQELPQYSRDGFNFQGWYLHIEGSDNQKVTSETVFNQNTTVYAEWEKQPEAVTVTFEANGGECGMEKATVNENKKLESLPNPTREGHVFLGWYIQDKNEKATLDTTYDKSTTLVAQWKKEVSVEKPDNATLGENFLKENTLAEGTEKVVVHVVQGNETKLAEISSNLGDALDGKKLLAVYDLSVQMLAADKKDLGELTSVNGLIRFDFTVTGNVVDVYHGTKAMSPSNGTTPGYRQTGNTLTIWANSFSPYAIVTDGSFVITLDPQGGTFEEGVSDKMTTNTEGELTEDLPTPMKTGYKFEGWYLAPDGTGEPVKKNETVFHENATIYAKWTPITYTVVFHDNYRATEKTCTQTLTYNNEEPLSYDATKINRDYYQLDGWAETKDGEKVYTTQDCVKNLCSQQGDEKHLYAVWSYDSRTVTFDACGGKIKENGQEENSVTVQTQESPINTVKAKDIPVPMAREGYYFGGWYTQKDGKGDLVKPDKTEFTEPRSTVYAYWVKFEPVTVTFNCWGGTARIGSTDVKEFTMQTKWPGVLDGTPTTPSRSSYKFEGWYTAAGVKVDEDTLFLRNSTVYARWKRAVSITGNPRTGDQVKLEAAIGILAAAAIGLGATVVLKKRKEK